MQARAVVGVVEHGNSAVLVTLTRDGQFRDRRRIDLTRDLPTHPYHHEGSWAVGRYANSPWARTISLTDAVALVAQVHEAATHGARAALDALAVSVPEVATVSIRACPALPATIEERITDTRSANVADSVMYREAIAGEARARGWQVHWYDRDSVPRQAAARLGVRTTDPWLRAMGAAIGPLWDAKYKLAAMAALAADF